MPTITSDYYLSSIQREEVKTKNSNLGKDDFLKLLIAQLQNQDPLNPMEDTEFISQMATFSTLEQMTNMNQAMEKLVQLQTQSSLIDFSQFIGKEVVWHKILDDNETIIEGEGIIATVQFSGEAVKFYLEDGTELYPGNITKVNVRVNDDSPIVRASVLIGKEIVWLDGENEYRDIVSSVSYKNGSLILNVENGEKVQINQVIQIS